MYTSSIHSLVSLSPVLFLLLHSSPFPFSLNCIVWFGVYHSHLAFQKKMSISIQVIGYNKNNTPRIAPSLNPWLYPFDSYESTAQSLKSRLCFLMSVFCLIFSPEYHSNMKINTKESPVSIYCSRSNQNWLPRSYYIVYRAQFRKRVVSAIESEKVKCFWVLAHRSERTTNCNWMGWHVGRMWRRVRARKNIIAMISSM